MQNNSHYLHQNYLHNHHQYHYQFNHHNNISISNNCYQSANLIIENEIKSEQQQGHQQQLATEATAIKIQAQQNTVSSVTTKTNLEEFTGNLKDENFSQSDEDEIIQFMERTKLRRADEESTLLSQENIIKQNYINCIAKSPELMVLDARESYQKYDNTVKEFKKSISKFQHQNEQQLIYQQQQQQHQTMKQSKIENSCSGTNFTGNTSLSQNSTFLDNRNMKNISSLSSSSAHHYEAKIEEQNQVFHDIRNQFDYLQQQQHEQQLQQKFVSTNQSINIENQLNEIKTEQKEDEEEYKKIPVKELISSFEKQTRPIENQNIVLNKRNNQKQQNKTQQQEQQNEKTSQPEQNSTLGNSNDTTVITTTDPVPETTSSQGKIYVNSELQQKIVLYFPIMYFFLKKYSYSNCN